MIDRKQWTVATGIQILMGLGMLCGGAWGLAQLVAAISAAKQQITDHIETGHADTVRLAEEVVRQQAVSQSEAAAVRADLERYRQETAATIAQNIMRRDAAEQQIRDGLNRLTDRVNELSNHITSREPHSEALPALPTIAGNT